MTQLTEDNERLTSLMNTRKHEIIARRHARAPGGLVSAAEAAQRAVTLSRGAKGRVNPLQDEDTDSAPSSAGGYATPSAEPQRGNPATTNTPLSEATAAREGPAGCARGSSVGLAPRRRSSRTNKTRGRMAALGKVVHTHLLEGASGPN